MADIAAKTVKRKPRLAGRKKKTWRSEWQRSWPLYVLLLPSVVLVLIFNYAPMGGVVMAFQDYKPWIGILKSPFVGLDNFKQIFAFQESYQAIINTFIIAVWKIVLGLIVPVTMAILLNEVHQMGLKKGIQTLVYLPHFLSWVTVAGMMKDILGLDGIVNGVLNWFGIKSIFFLGEAGMFRQIAVASDIWKGFGFGMIVYLAAIASIDPNTYEAAEMDGASRWQQTIHVTLPGILPMVIVMATLSLGNVLNAGFDQIFNLYSPLTYRTGDIIDTYVYRQSLLNGQYSFGTAVGLFKSGIGLFLTVVAYKLAYKFAGYKIF
ncbi:ABC transporter permease [Schleiferilactobacillus harbinensis]|jgi:putative aldouronate transport system permease protein|uniref:ABC transporter permease n=1 Tax=Schleiferilactobacillus harbinensis TaxID=304207 RepID=UPI00243117E7|nr:ABC transporter permease subunit [Schleiferilactobacillus harbinensis]MCI1688078.1 ABC transporter permease subunit [Schleiferilactobacillus harbinensis]MCI1782977.1 ABC transporter permease subunit [Schleiferilactobacillus harbinensis]MCI1851502.1 ABC transporter permease subunit [Schleiferilactobacillus harbinensis]